MPDELKKTCTRCLQSQPASSFHRNKRRPADTASGWVAVCRTCTKLANDARHPTEPVTEGEKFCPRCETQMPITDFGVNRAARNGRHSECRKCAALRSRLERTGPAGAVIKEKARLRSFARYQLTEADYQDLLAAQGGVCGICKKQPEPNGKRLRVDHDPACCPGKYRSTCGLCTRGLLCDMCNRGLGYFGDSSAMIGIALSYLLRAERRLLILKNP